ncbi:MAG TPA: NAD(P)-dependent alcohol dehydrogenase [Ohtaekwangia sp.]
MKAVLCTQYGPPEVLHLMDVDQPVPGDNDVLIKIHCATVTMGDCELRNLTLPRWTRLPVRLIMGYSKPKRLIPGMEFSGVVEAVGKEVHNFKKGDTVFGSGGMKMGAYAEYTCCPSTAITLKPLGVSFADAATIIVGGLNALHFLRKANIQPGQKVLVIGAGGNIGTYGVLFAKLHGAEVTAVDSTSKLDMLRSIGADHVIDYTKEDFSASGKKYDVIFDLIYKSSFTKCVKALTETGYYLMANTGPRRMLRGLWVSCTSKKRIVSAMAGLPVPDMNHIATLIADGKIKPVIDKTYPLSEVVEAHTYVEKGYKKGCVILIINDV